MLQKTVFASLMISSFVGAAFAQSSRSDSLRNELSSEVEVLYNESGGTIADTPVRVAALPAKRRATRQAPQVVVLAPPSNNSYVEKRPTAFVDSSPLDESNAAKMRRQREAAEAQTEMKIVEKLETDRMESERERAARLFGNKWDKPQEPVQPQQAKVQAEPQRVILVNPGEQELEREDFKQDLREVVSELNASESKASYEEDYTQSDSDFYISVGGGAGLYPDTRNIDGGYRLAFSVGWDYDYGMAVDLGLGFSEYDLFDCFGSSCNPSSFGGSLKTIKQTDLSLLVNYKFSNRSRFTPTVGGVSSIVFRDYASNGIGLSSNTVKSRALDLGLSGGVQIELSPNIQVVGDVRYMFNIVKDVDADGFSPFGFYNTPGTVDVEELQYFLINFGLKFFF